MELTGYLHLLVHICQGESTGIHLIRGVMGPRSSQIAMDKRKILASLGNEPQFIGCPADSLVTILVGIIMCPLSCIF
jgi:hypothetical protein